MPTSAAYDLRHAACLKAIAGHLPSGNKELLRFTEIIYAKHPVTDLEKIDPARAASIANSAFAFLQQRQAGTPNIRIFNESEEGAKRSETGRTVIQIANDDMPFLVDSFAAELTRQGFILHALLHPILRVERDAKAALLGFADSEDAGKGNNESFIHAEISAVPEGASLEALKNDLLRVFAHVSAAVRDWKPIASKLPEIRTLHSASLGRDAAMLAEECDFLAWLGDKHFIFLGYAEVESGSEKPVHTLGICTIHPELVEKHTSHAPVEVSKSAFKSIVHRPVLMDVVTIKKVNEAGAPIGEYRFFGLFTSIVYYCTAETIPFIRRKISNVIARAGFAPVSHDGKALKTILEFFPRDEMFQTSEEELFETALGILSLEARPSVRIFIRRDTHGRFVYCMLYVPREYYSTSLREQTQIILEQSLGGKVENFYTQVTDAPLARVQIVLRTDPRRQEGIDASGIEHSIARFTRQRGDMLRGELGARFGAAEGERYFRMFEHAFPASYIETYDIPSTVHDVAGIVRARSSQRLVIDLYQRKNEPEFPHLKLFSPAEEIALSDILPMLEHMGFRVIEEQPFTITPALDEAGPVWIRDIKLALPDQDKRSLEPLKPALEEALQAIWHKQQEDDSFNALVLFAGLSIRQVACLRAYARYLKQIGFSYAQSVIEKALNAHPAIARLLIDLFYARFDPVSAGDTVKQAYTEAQIESALSQVSNLAEDTIIRRYVALIKATLRTNYFQTGKDVISFKFDSGQVPELPLPRPFAEIFVYGMRVEGIHLRGGKVARGGIRWSDRSEDFRTEVLGLMKAQMVKNAVIVPVGSKGGFIVKKPPAAREALLQEGIACYTHYLQGLLDITDNVVGGEVVPPVRTLRYDGDDPYLVVAADKGTATFSDIANGVSKTYGFWLDDAFASGGSVGYDHKKMAITARGAWISVARHFQEMGRDIAKESFTAVGIGDMAGDVFGNGMLLSGTMQLVAAFNHLHIFIDPNPDAKASFAERQRLFNLPRSSWKDYDAKLISKGGGIYERSAKQIILSAEAQSALGITASTLTPDELIRSILRAPVDLLWNGGIGTYVKAEDETHDQVGDRANNAVRVSGKELRCKVVGEGGNLGFTQKGRIEYARAGGRINTDAIDNSGGVDCSDHEVNIKIALAPAVASNALPLDARNALLADMTEEVANLVLKDNTLQTGAITIAERQAPQLLKDHIRLMQELEAQGLLNRKIEYLPSDRQLEELAAQGKGLTRPELAVLLAYSKIALYRELVESPLLDEPYFAVDLLRYFPKALQAKFKDFLLTHPLRREIIATVGTNSLVNRAGLTFYHTIKEETGLAVRDIASAYTIARDAYGLRSVWADMEKLHGVPVDAQVSMHTAITGLLERVTLWVLRNVPAPLAVEATLSELQPGVEALYRITASLPSESLKAEHDAQQKALVSQQIPESLAGFIATLPFLASAPDIIRLSQTAGISLEQAAGAYVEAGETLQLTALRASADRLVTATHWDYLAKRALITDLLEEQRRIAGEMLGLGNNWKTLNAQTIARHGQMLGAILAREQIDLSMLMVALRHIKALRF